MTWSIIARDEPTGRVGIIVATRFFAVGSMVPHIKTGVGAIASQAFINPLYGPRGLALLEAGLGAEETVGRLTAADAGRDNRQLHAMDREGIFAAYTGAACIDWCGHALRPTFSAHRGSMLRVPPFSLTRSAPSRLSPPCRSRGGSSLRCGRARRPVVQARQAVGGAADPRWGGLSALRSTGGRSRRSPGRAGAAAGGGARALGALPPLDADPAESLGADRPERARGTGREVDRGGL